MAVAVAAASGAASGAPGGSVGADAHAAAAAPTTPPRQSKLTAFLASSSKFASFAPLAVLPALRDTHAIAALAACTAISLLTLAATFLLKRRQAIRIWPKRLDLLSLLVYASMLVAACFREHAVGVWASAVQNTALFVFMFATVLLGTPFTADWAKDSAPPQAWSTPLFKWSCDSVAWLWSAAMAVMAVGSIATAARPDWRPQGPGKGPPPAEFWIFGVALGLGPLPIAIIGQHVLVHIARKRAVVLRAKAAEDAAAAAAAAKTGADAV